MPGCAPAATRSGRSRNGRAALPKPSCRRRRRLADSVEDATRSCSKCGFVLSLLIGSSGMTGVVFSWAEGWIIAQGSVVMATPRPGWGSPCRTWCGHRRHQHSWSDGMLPGVPEIPSHFATVLHLDGERGKIRALHRPHSMLRSPITRCLQSSRRAIPPGTHRPIRCSAPAPPRGCSGPRAHCCCCGPPFSGRSIERPTADASALRCARARSRAF